MVPEGSGWLIEDVIAPCCLHARTSGSSSCPAQTMMLLSISMRHRTHFDPERPMYLSRIDEHVSVRSMGEGLPRGAPHGVSPNRTCTVNIGIRHKNPVAQSNHTPAAESYCAILADGQLRWLDEVLDAIRDETEELRVRVTIEEAGGQNENDLGGLVGRGPRPESRHRVPCLPAPSVLGAGCKLNILDPSPTCPNSPLDISTLEIAYPTRAKPRPCSA